jgi:hypothetical protein
MAIRGFHYSWFSLCLLGSVFVVDWATVFFYRSFSSYCCIRHGTKLKIKDNSTTMANIQKMPRPQKYSAKAKAAVKKVTPRHLPNSQKNQGQEKDSRGQRRL